MNRIWKVLLPIVLVMALIVGTMPAFAAESPTTKAIGSVKVKSTVYNGRKQTPVVKVYDADGNRISSKYYKVKVKGTPRNAGTYKVTVTAKAPYTGRKTAKFVIKKAENPFVISIGRKNFDYSRTDSQSTSIKVRGVKGGAKLSGWSTSDKKILVKGGKVIIKKWFYGKAVIAISTKATKNYKATRKTVMITVKK